MIGDLIAAGVVLLLIWNLFSPNKIISRTVGIIFLFGSCYMLLALFDDYLDGEATMGYLIGLLLFTASAVCSILFIWGYTKNNKIN